MGRYGLSASGFGIALVGFLLTRFTVTLAATDTTVEFLAAGAVPLAAGLGLTVAGVMLAVGRYDREFVRTTAVWSLLGTGAMLVLVVLTLVGAGVELTDTAEIRDQTYLSTFLIGGAIGGTLTGMYAGWNRCNQRALRQQANRLTVLNRLLRDRVINAATVIRGHHDILANEYEEDSVEVVGQQADRIVEIVENVGYLTERDQQSTPTDLTTVIETELDTVRAEYPDANVTFEGDSKSVVRANARVREVFANLFENAIRHSNADVPRLAVTVETTRGVATVRVSDNGPGLPADQQALLERGEIAEFDDPTAGFGLNIARLLVESFDGDIQTIVDDEGSTIEVDLPRVDPPSQASTAVTTAKQDGTTPGPVPSRTAMAGVVGVVAGLAMSTAMAAFDGDFLAIGSLYGIANPLIAHLTHEFHSVVFALVYAGLLAVVPLSYAADARGRIALAVGFSLSLWLFAAGLVMPVWLELVGVAAPIPNLSLPSLVGHVVWGLTTGSLYHAGDLWLDRTEFSDRVRLGALDPR
jgi:two-component system OmpR family sensor kinase